MDNQTSDNKENDINFSEGYISITLEDAELGFYKQLEHKIVAYRHFHKGREFKVFADTIEAECWILKNKYRLSPV